MTQLGGAQYTPGTGQWSGEDMSAAADQLQPGDTARAEIAFPFPITFLPGDAIAAVLSPVFAAAGQRLQGVDFDGDSTLVLIWTVG